MTYHLILSAGSAVSAMAVVTSESIDAWGKLGSVGILGALCVGFGYLHFRTIKELSTSHRDAVKEHHQRATSTARVDTRTVEHVLVNREMED
jgi:hypothetical protein